MEDEFFFIPCDEPEGAYPLGGPREVHYRDRGWIEDQFYRVSPIDEEPDDCGEDYRQALLSEYVCSGGEWSKKVTREEHARWLSAQKSPS